MHEEKHFRIKMTDEEKKRNEKKDDEGIYSPQLNTMFGLCAICHLAVGNINSAFNQNVPCCEEHILCQRCIEQFSIPSDPGCILCHEQFQQSNLSIPQESNTSLNSIYIHPRRMHIPRQQPEYYVKHHQSEQSNVKNWKQNYSTAVTNTERNMWGYYNADDSEESTDYERIKDQNNIHEERGKDDSKQRQQYSCCNLYKRGNTDLYMTEARVNGQITAECSRRPIRCPRIDCAINVAFSALTHHFIFDHPEVPILNVEPGIKSTLIVSFNALSLDSSRCLALLLVSGKLSDPVARLFNGSQINPKFRNRLPLPVLAARLQCNKINNKKDYHKKNIIIAWVAGIDIGNTADKLLCSIQAVDKFDSEGLRSLTYTGPVNSLRTAQCPQDIFSTGDCIVLHEGLLSHITSDCATLNVNVTVH
ncbi:hypothetical protein WN55_10047 [Dufourea novaeangliae]|uniref:DUF4729 domain-containing protein n=2 Tax=Dufourea novaeangliae TaxID=178035 RepID=A0A154P8C0_DUFNO|nr:hypothetical protein WN55_10047 [Dufourea novaeangliae]